MFPLSNSCSIVSVPCRGTTFLNLVDKEKYPNISQKCFRPLSGNYISQCTLHLCVATQDIYIVSVPCRGTTFLNCDGVFYLVEKDWFIVSVPCRGTTFLNECERITIKTATVVSVPCRGTTFLNKIHDQQNVSRLGFPSPVGELHFSIRYNVWNPIKYGFRPLSGNYISQFYLSKSICNGFTFPSPVGELHFSMGCE